MQKSFNALFASFKVEASLMLAGALFQSLAAAIVKLLAACFVLQSSFQIIVVPILTTLSCEIGLALFFSRLKGELLVILLVGNLMCQL